jgi:hypothetical protein
MQHDRIRTSIPVEIRSSKRVAEGTVRNASDGGMFVETREIPPQGEAVSLRFSTRSAATLEVTGLVWWTTEGSAYRHARRGFGLRLLEEDERYSEMLAGLRPRPRAAALLAPSQRSPADRIPPPQPSPVDRISPSQRKVLAAALEASRESGRPRRR